ncbi:YncE family protein [Mycobacterium sp.]|uniref:YncE family protein n=1 Tax=Mycobacterium sp. TaxID=1785 RepID=UPI003C44BD6E
MVVHIGVVNSRYTLACLLEIGLLVAGCSSNAGSSAPTTTPVPAHAATPAAEPATAGAPAGKVVAIGNAPEGVVIGNSGIGAVAVRNPDGVELIDATTGAVRQDATTGAVRQTVPTVGAARHLSLAGPDGPALVPLEGSDELCELTLVDGRVTSATAGVGRQPHDAARTAGGTIVVTNERGGGVVVASLPAGPVQPGGVAAVGDYAAVADVQGNGVWVYDGSTHRQMAHGPVGMKLTHAVAVSGDLAAFADTDGGAVFVERIDPQLAQVAKIDAPGKPYGLAYDAARRRLYVTLTAFNLMRMIDISDPAKPRVLGDVPTMQQPNSVAIDPRSGNVLVTGSDPDGGSGLQIVTPDLLP